MSTLSINANRFNRSKFANSNVFSSSKDTKFKRFVNSSDSTDSLTSSVVGKSKPFKRGDSEQAPLQKKALVVLGATSQMGPSVIKSGVEKGYDKIISLSRRESNGKNFGPVHPVQIDESKITEVAYWEEFLRKNIEEGVEVNVINLIGSSVAPEGKTLEDINEKPILALAEALDRMNEKYYRVALGHFSTIAASYFPDSTEEQRKYFCEQAIQYCGGRKRVDKALLNSGLPVTIVRPGYIFKDMIQGKIIDTGHAYSPEQFATLPVQPVLGSGTQIQQPVYQQDVIDAVLNGTNHDSAQMIDAVGPESMTQAELFKFFVEMAGKEFKPVNIPYPLAHSVAKHSPRGRIAPYSIGMFKYLEENGKEPLCQQKFEKLVGKTLTSMAQIYQLLENETVVFTKPPIREHAKDILKVATTNSSAFFDLAHNGIKHGPKVIKEGAKKFLSVKDASAPVDKE